MKKITLLTIFMSLFSLSTLQCFAAIPVRKTDVDTARSGACMVAVKGSFIKADKQAILKRINEIRYEACKEGIINENTGEPLTLADYVPVKWSRKLQELAETRAAEASVVFNHSRLNGWICPHTVIEDGYTYAEHTDKICQTNNYVSATLECLAMQGSSASPDEGYMDQIQMSFMEAIEMWYDEKPYLGGHYMALINNDMDYIGMAVFQSDEIDTDLNNKEYKHRTVEANGALELTNKSWAEFYEDDYLQKLSDDSVTGLAGEYLQMLELKSSRIKGFFMNKTNKQTLNMGDKDSLYTVFHVDNDTENYSMVRYVGSVTWSSSNPAVVSVDQHGNILAAGAGEATIIAKTSQGQTAKCVFKVNKTESSIKRTEVSRIIIKGVSKKTAPGRKIRLTATVYPKIATNKKLNWTTSNKKYATVTQTGLVKVNKKAGGKTVRITAKAKDGSGKKAVWKILIMKGAVSGITVKGYRKTLKAGKTMKLRATVKVTKGKPVNKKLKWTSSNPKYATITQSGLVKALSAGKGRTVKITVQSTDGTNKKVVKQIKIQ